jgi:hypothetical protein
MPTGPPRAGHDGGILVRLTGRGGRGRTGPPRSGGRYGLLLAVLIATYLLSAFNGRNLATESQIGLFAVVLLLALRTSPLPGRWPLAIGTATVAGAGYLRMLTARETTRTATSSEIASSVIIMSFAQGLIAETSVGLNAVAVVNERWR